MFPWYAATKIPFMHSQKRNCAASSRNFHTHVSASDLYIPRMWMRTSLVVRASDCQCTSCNGPGFDPSIRRHSGIWGRQMKQCWILYEQKEKNPPQKIFKKYYIPRIIPHIFLQNRQTDPGNTVYKSLKTQECGNCDWGCPIPFPGIFVSIFCYYVFAV